MGISHQKLALRLASGSEVRRTPLLTNLNFGEYPFHAVGRIASRCAQIAHFGP
jgi:hypothetical protein